MMITPRQTSRQTIGTLVVDARPHAGLEKNITLADASPRGSLATSVLSHCAEVMRASGATQDRSMHTHTMRDSMQSAPVLGRGRRDTGRLAGILDFQSRFGVLSKKTGDS